MLKLRISISVLVLTVAAMLGAQEKTPAAAGFDAQACAKHCQEMAAAHQKMMDAQKAMMEKHQAAWKDIQAQLDIAKKARGDKKVAALEAAIEKLVAFHESMQKAMAESPMMMHGGMMGCCGPDGMGMGMGIDCPMMKGMKTGPESSTKSPN
jgi:Skp family chaperone for outer membrane proteins